MVHDIDYGMFDSIKLASGAKLLYLDDKVYKWSDPDNAGVLELLSATNIAPDLTSNKIYRLQKLSEQPYSKSKHLDLIYNQHKVLGYFLPYGLPEHWGDRRLIIPTNTLVVVTTTRLKNMISRFKQFSSRSSRPVTGTT